LAASATCATTIRVCLGRHFEWSALSRYIGSRTIRPKKTNYRAGRSSVRSATWPSNITRTRRGRYQISFRVEPRSSAILLTDGEVPSEN
jgi:hypothetical protein